MACCGNKAIPASQAVPVRLPAMNDLLIGVDGLTQIKYIGGNVGSMTWFGPTTKIRYIAGGTRSLLYVDVRDAITGSTKNPGFLEMLEHGKPVFEKVA